MKDPDLDRGSLPEVVIVVNSPLGMSTGKLIGQAFQAAFRNLPSTAPVTEDQVLQVQTFIQWVKSGTRTIVRFAHTPGIFERVVKEVPGYVMTDEGFTEVSEGTATMLIVGPHLHRNRPKLLDNKKLNGRYLKHAPGGLGP